MITARFKAAAEAAGLPPIRFHDGRHAAATYTKAAGGDLLDLRKKLGHASITVTADHYPAQLDEVDRALAERTAALIPRQRPHPSGPVGSTASVRIADDSRSDRSTVPQACTKTSRKRRARAGSRRAVPLGNDHGQARNDQVNPRSADTLPVVFLAPTSPAVGQWPPPGRRRDRYPRDLN